MTYLLQMGFRQSLNFFLVQLSLAINQERRWNGWPGIFIQKGYSDFRGQFYFYTNILDVHDADFHLWVWKNEWVRKNYLNHNNNPSNLLSIFYLIYIKMGKKMFVCLLVCGGQMEIQTPAPILMKFSTHIPTCPRKVLV